MDITPVWEVLFVLSLFTMCHNVSSSEKKDMGPQVNKVVKESYRIKRSDPGVTVDTGKMIENSQQSQSEAIQMMGMGAAIGTAFGPIGTAIGGAVGGLLCLFLCKHETPPPPPNKLPTFSSPCPNRTETVIADEGKDTATHTWEPPTATDPEDGRLEIHLRQGGAPGSSFSRGEHTIIYEATDKNGALASCFFSFTVKVLSCDPPQWPLNGYVHCAKSEITLGTSCTVGCFPGFHMTPNTEVIKCVSTNNNKAHMDSSIPSCQEITCPMNVTKMKPQHGKPLCTHNSHKFDSACTTQCELGYNVKAMMFSVCQNNRTWSSKLMDCEDSERPEINNCPNTIYAYTDRSKHTATVNWTIPTATDNSNKVTIKRTRGPAPGSSFRVGLTEIRYKATDSSNNESPECIFFVAVEEVRCTPPIITDRYMTYRCPDGFTYGSSCHLQCMGRFPLVGNEDIVCQKNSTTDPPRGYWDYGGVKPYCKRIPCRDLPAPINGAMSCDTWMFGRQCQMQCSDKYDIPALGPTAFNGVFTCSEKEGTFKPVNTVPNCTEIRLPGHIETLGEFFYYTGTCGDGTVSEQIKSNFIKQMEDLEKNGFAGVCSDSNQCNVGNVSVTCGPSSSRRRRSLDSGINTVRLKRASSEIRVEIRLFSLWQNSNSSKSDSFEFAKKIQKQMFGQVQDLSRTGKLTVNGLTPDSESFLLGYSVPLCPEGLSIRMTTLTCVPCTSGSYLTFNHRRKPICKPCPKGFYKENEIDVQCTQCPDGTSTDETGSTHASDCIDICHPGEYSNIGLSPCTPCDKSTYQNTSMSTKCIQCPKDMATAFTGSTDASNCSEFDVVFKQHGHKIELKKSSIAGVSLGLTIMSWVKSSDVTMDMTLYHSQSFSVKIQDKMLIKKASLREWISTDVSIQNGTWTHVAVVIQKSDPVVSVFIDGKQKFISRNGLLVSDAELAVGLNDANMMLNSETISGVFLSGYQVVPQPFSRDQIVQIAKTCSSKSAQSIISMEDLKTANPSGVEIIVPSQCDNVNECNNNPCHGHTCIDRIKGYTCQCGNGYSGIHCEEKPDFCKHQPCQNDGTCTNTDDGNYNCSCTEGFKGTRCEKKIANGGWSSWSQFSDCSVSCNGGTKVRTRVCNSPPPDPEGIPCNVSETTEHASCNSEKCPSCSHLRRRFGNILHCKRSVDDHEVCTVTCRPGYSFVPGHIPLPEYKCGRNTSYKWTGIPPACGEVNIPEQISTITVVSYKDSITCDKASQASRNLQQKLESSLQCAKNKTCTLAVEAKECLSDHRRKRSVSTQSHHVTLTSRVSEKIDVENIAKTQKPNDAAKKFMLGVSELELSVQQLNSSGDMLNLNVNGTIFISTGQITKSVIHCPSGQGRVLFFCANCPPGTHSSGECVLCNIGTYQDEAGQTECKRCPLGMTTKYVGSQDQIDCAVKGEDSSERKDLSRGNADENKTLIIFTTTISVLICLGLVIGFTIFGYKKYLRLRRRRNSKINGSLASLNMVSPSEYTSRDYVPMASKPKFSM